MSEKSLNITPQPVFLKNSYLYIPRQRADFFPAGDARTKKPITIESNTEPFTAQLQYNSKAYV